MYFRFLNPIRPAPSRLNRWLLHCPESRPARAHVRVNSSLKSGRLSVRVQRSKNPVLLFQKEICAQKESEFPSKRRIWRRGATLRVMRTPAIPRAIRRRRVWLFFKKKNWRESIGRTWSARAHSVL